MRATQPRIAQYLLQHDLISLEHVVNGDIRIIDVSRRNRNFKVISEHGPSYILKQAAASDGVATVAREASVYRFLRAHITAETSSHHVPRFVRYDSTEHLLVLELLPDAQDFHEYHSRLGRFPRTVAQSMGTSLSEIHRSAWIDALSADDVGLLNHEPPWILSLHRPDLSIFDGVSSANLHLIKILQQHRDWCDRVEAVRKRWRVETLVHFDIKWDNCVVCRRSARRKSIALIDWEFAGLGDPCWDVASVFSGYLSFWLLSIPITGQTPPDRFPELARCALTTMQPAMRAFWDSYAHGMRLRGAVRSEWLARAVEYTAATLVQTAFEQMQPSSELTASAICSLQVGLNILRRPQEAMVHLLGIPLHETGSS